jgi:hypothetical protein
MIVKNIKISWKKCYKFCSLLGRTNALIEFMENFLGLCRVVLVDGTWFTDLVY